MELSLISVSIGAKWCSHQLHWISRSSCFQQALDIILQLSSFRFISWNADDAVRERQFFSTFRSTRTQSISIRRVTGTFKTIKICIFTVLRWNCWYQGTCIVPADCRQSTHQVAEKSTSSGLEKSYTLSMDGERLEELFEVWTCWTATLLAMVWILLLLPKSALQHRLVCFLGWQAFPPITASTSRLITSWRARIHEARGWPDHDTETEKKLWPKGENDMGWEKKWWDRYRMETSGSDGHAIYSISETQTCGRNLKVSRTLSSPVML